MFFKKKVKITWYADEDNFTVLANKKELSGGIPNNWLGDDLLIFLEKYNKYYLLENYEDNSDNQLRDAKHVADGNSLLWSKLDGGYYLFENGETVNDESEPIRIKDIMLTSYQGNIYLFKNYDQTEDNILQEAILINDSNEIHWIKVKEYFYILSRGKLMDLSNTAICGFVRNDSWIGPFDDSPAFSIFNVSVVRQFSLKAPFRSLCHYLPKFCLIQSN